MRQQHALHGLINGEHFATNKVPFRCRRGVRRRRTAAARQCEREPKDEAHHTNVKAANGTPRTNHLAHPTMIEALRHATRGVNEQRTPLLPCYPVHR